MATSKVGLNNLGFKMAIECDPLTRYKRMYKEICAMEDMPCVKNIKIVRGQCS